MNLIIRTIMDREEVFYAIRFGSWVYTYDRKESQWEWCPEDQREASTTSMPETPKARIF